ncbi:MULTISPECIES: hypothetical protein [Xenorhabdus]|uniref:hypothetical protein n=1 Tax=Xenorhabdus TaxID=626 RepID=UPI00068D9D81|nr:MULTISPECIES: hypothetical protein [Xenorhabdus]
MTKKKKQFIEDMIRLRGIDFARIGMMVEVGGDIGTITGVNSSANIDVVFANQQKYGKHHYNCHPTFDIKYFDEQGDVIFLPCNNKFLFWASEAQNSSNAISY